MTEILCMYHYSNTKMRGMCLVSVNVMNTYFKCVRTSVSPRLFSHTPMGLIKMAYKIMKEMRLFSNLG